MNRESYYDHLMVAMDADRARKARLVPSSSGLLVPAGSGSVETVNGSGSAVAVPMEDAEPVPVPVVPGSADTAVPDRDTDGGPARAAESEQKLTGWKMFALVATVVLAVALFAYAAAGSYASVGQLAAHHKVPLPSLVPLGIDGSLILALLSDIVLTWIGHPIWWLRASARGFVAGSVAANAAAGWPDPVAVFLHCFPPIIIMLVTEAGRVPLLRKHAAKKRDQAKKEGHDGIPWERWAAAPVSTAVMWRRMALWGVKSYETAVAAEVTRRRAIVQLRMHYGRRWRSKAPGDLVWLLRTGNRLEEASAKVTEITSPESGTDRNQGTGTARQKKTGTGNRNPRTRNRGRGRNRHGQPGNPDQKTGTRPGRTRNQAAGNHATADLDPALVEDVRTRMANHRKTHGRDITVEEMRIAIGRRKAVAGALMRAARAQGIPDAQDTEETKR